MKWTLRLTLTALVVLASTEALFACSLVMGGEEVLIAESVTILRNYQKYVLIVFSVGVLITLIRRGKGWGILCVQAIFLALSPGWFPDANAGYDHGCEPAGSFEMPFILATQVVALVAQIGLYLEDKFRTSRSKNLP